MKSSPVSVPLIMEAIDNQKILEAEDKSCASKQMRKYIIYLLEELLENVCKKSNLGEKDV